MSVCVGVVEGVVVGVVVVLVFRYETISAQAHSCPLHHSNLHALNSNVRKHTHVRKAKHIDPSLGHTRQRLQLQLQLQLRLCQCVGSLLRMPLRSIEQMRRYLSLRVHAAFRHAATPAARRMLCLRVGTPSALVGGCAHVRKRYASMCAWWRSSMCACEHGRACVRALE